MKQDRVFNFPPLLEPRDDDELGVRGANLLFPSPLLDLLLLLD